MYCFLTFSGIDRRMRASHEVVLVIEVEDSGKERSECLMSGGVAASQAASTAPIRAVDVRGQPTGPFHPFSSSLVYDLVLSGTLDHIGVLYIQRLTMSASGCSMWLHDCLHYALEIYPRSGADEHQLYRKSPRQAP